MAFVVLVDTEQKQWLINTDDVSCAHRLDDDDKTHGEGWHTFLHLRDGATIVLYESLEQLADAFNQAIAQCHRQPQQGFSYA